MKIFKNLFLLVGCILLSNTLKSQQANTVVDGKARFTVLTPTLIRTEYAGDSLFETKKTFTVTNLDLPTPAFTTKAENGWREIQTEKMTLRYKQNSGIFDTTNLVVGLNINEKAVTAKPWNMSVSGSKCEAEKARLSGGATVARDHTGYSGSGFGAGLISIGAAMEWTLNNNVPAGDYQFSVRYSNGMGGPRTLSLYVDNIKTQITLEKTANWDSWGTYQKAVSLGTGSHTFKLVCEEGDTYNVNIDWMALSPFFNVNQICEAEDAALTGSASTATDHKDYTGSSFVAGLLNVGAGMEWSLNNRSGAGDYSLSIKYANGVPGDNQHIDRSLSLYIDGVKTQITLPKTTNWDTWGLFQKNITLSAGYHTIRLMCDAGDTYNVNIDWMAVSPVGAELPKPQATVKSSNLGGWTRSLDLKTGKVPMWDGLLSKNGWYLIDDSQTALTEADGWVSARPFHAGGYQDGYFFAYGTDFQTAISDFYQITGTPPLLPKWAFGVWFSKYNAYKSTDYQNTILPKFRSDKVPLDVLVIDTDWKANYSWNGWGWSKSLFPDPEGFMNWSRQQGLKVTLNIHPSIEEGDPKFAQANSTAGGLLGQGRRLFDFSIKNHAKAYFDLHQPFDQQGIRFWWLDWCGDGPDLSLPGLPGDTWINSLYAKNSTDRGERGFAFSRIGGGYKNYADLGIPGTSWADHRYTIHFTGDSQDTWELLAFASTYTLSEANIGLPYVSHDLGSFNGKQLSDDMYMRWVQFGTFQPIFRLHSDHGQRLPWEYPNVTKQAEEFLRLRHALIPYTYTAAYETSKGGLPIVRGLYYEYPNASQAYTFDKQYLFGKNMLVAPVVTAGAKANTSVWFPEGTWINFFTNETVTGPLTKTISSTYTTMPVYVKAGGIVPLASYSDFVGQTADDSLTLRVYGGADGEFTLYEDQGDNLDYQKGQFAQTRFVYNEGQRKVTIQAQQGIYAGAPEKRSYEVVLYNAVVPESVLLNGTALQQTTAGNGEGWWVDGNQVHIRLGKRAVAETYTITLEGVGTALTDTRSDEEILICPNPAVNSFTLKLAKTDNPSKLWICNAKGEKILDTVISAKSTTINTSSYHKGIYLVKVENQGKFFTEKLIID